MAKAASRASTTTVLRVGVVEIGVGLFSTEDKPGKLAAFETAGPNGGRLVQEMRGREIEADPEPEMGDPLAEELHARGKTAEEFEQMLGQDGRVHSAAELIGGPPSENPDVEQVREMIAADLQEKLDSDVIGAPAEFVRVLVEEGSGQVVEPEQVRKGVRRADGTFIDCTEKLAEIEAQTKLERMDVIDFIDATTVNRGIVRGAKYIGAMDERAPKALRLLFHAMRATRRAAVVKVTKRSRQTLGVIVPAGKTLQLLELVWHEDFRPPPPRALEMHEVEVTQAEIELATRLVHEMSASPEVLSELRDDAIEMREQLYADALAGHVAPAASGDVTDASDVIGGLMAALEASVAG